MSTISPPLLFPPLFDLDPGHRAWPQLPFAWRHIEAPGVDTQQPCRIEFDEAPTAEGDLLAFDVDARGLAWRRKAGGPREELSFDRCRRLTLLTPLLALDADQSRRQSLLGALRPIEHAGHPVAAVLPLAEHERSYTLEPRHGGRVLTGRSVGYVETPEGLFLFEPSDDDTALRRVFVPRCIDGGVVTLARTALEAAMEDWAADPASLLRQVEALRQRRVPPLGLAAQSLGLLTAAQVARWLTDTTDDRPLGRVLVDCGLLSHAQLQAVIAHKMGCPIVDLTRFVPEPAALLELPSRVAWTQRTLPLCIAQDRLYIASDRVLDDERRRALQAYTRLNLVPVLARTAHLSEVLRDLDAGAGAGASFGA